MKIVILEGSPNRQGSSNMLAEKFKMGAEEAGHDTIVISAAHSEINPCIGCISCGYGGFCHAAILLRNVCSIKDFNRPFLCI